ncbi:MAG: phosphate/phosphite/phosphonate ABC transporter substrate-binding protein [Acetobacteraceae bacterium]|nr:phosphate/phosphite/phosphonate ABC transporter substrate-binding protein [Acetobacteraceae bacterium]
MLRVSALAAAAGLLLGASALAPAPARAQAAADCPNNGTLRFGVEPYEAAARLTPIYNHVGDLLGKKIGCKVEVLITTNYTAEIEAMRSGKLEAGEFGPLGYVLAHQVAKAEAGATFGNKEGQPETYTAGIVTWPGSGITELKGVAGHSFAYSDPTSTSGHLFPAYALSKAGINPDTGVKGIYAGSHGASFEALRNHKVNAGELNSQEIAAATIAGSYKPDMFVELWRSNPIPIDPIAIAPSVQGPFRDKLISVLQTLDLKELPPADLKIIGSSGGRLVPQTDAAYNDVRDLVHVLNIDLNKLS